MFACTLVLILILPVTFLSLTIENSFTPEELTEMGIRLGNSSAMEVQ